MRIYLCLSSLVLGMAASSQAASNCSFNVAKSVMALAGNCQTDATIAIPNGMTLEGNGFTITAVDPPGGHFVGGVIANGGASASVNNLVVTTSALANVCDGGVNRLRGIIFDGASGRITNNRVLNIRQGISGCQEGNAIEVRNFGAAPGTVHAVIDGNTVSGYQKTGIVMNGAVSGSITDNTVTGAGPIGYIAQNGIQIGYGASPLVKRNRVTGNSYTGASAASGGILVVGGPGYAGDFCVGVDITQNTAEGNDVGVYISQYEADFSAPAAATNIKVVNNVIRHDAVTNGYVYQAGVSDVGNNDKIVANRISGAGYDPATLPGATYAVDADPSFTNRAKVHANK